MRSTNDWTGVQPLNPVMCLAKGFPSTSCLWLQCTFRQRADQSLIEADPEPSTAYRGPDGLQMWSCQSLCMWTACQGCECWCRVMTESFGHIWEIAQQKKLPLRTAAFVKALQSVTRAHLHRGFD